MTRGDSLLHRCARILRRDYQFFVYDRWQTTGLKYQEDEALAALIFENPVDGVAAQFRPGMGKGGSFEGSTLYLKVTHGFDLAGLERLAELVAIAQSTAALEAMQ